MDGIRKKSVYLFLDPFGDSLDQLRSIGYKQLLFYCICSPALFYMEEWKRSHAKLLFTKFLFILYCVFYLGPKKKINVVSAACLHLVDGKEFKPEFNHPGGNILAS